MGNSQDKNLQRLDSFIEESRRVSGYVNGISAKDLKQWRDALLEPRQVHVVMSNDYPDEVFAGQDVAEAYAKAKNEHPDNQAYGHRRIHYRVYTFDVRDKAP